MTPHTGLILSRRRLGEGTIGGQITFQTAFCPNSNKPQVTSVRFKELPLLLSSGVFSSPEERMRTCSWNADTVPSCGALWTCNPHLLIELYTFNNGGRHKEKGSSSSVSKLLKVLQSASVYFARCVVRGWICVDPISQNLDNSKEKRGIIKALKQKKNQKSGLLVFSVMETPSQP